MARAFDPWVLGLGVVPVKPAILDGVTLSFVDVETPAGPRRAMVSTKNGSTMLRGVRVEPTPISSAWRARLGAYRNGDAGDDEITIERAVLVEEDGFLLLKLSLTRYPRPLTVVLRVLDDDEAVTAGYGRSMGETVRVERDASGERLVVVGYPLVRAD